MAATTARTVIHHNAVPERPYDKRSRTIRTTAAANKAVASTRRSRGAAASSNISPPKSRELLHTKKSSNRAANESVQPASPPEGTLNRPIDLTDDLSEVSAPIIADRIHARKARHYAADQNVLDAAMVPAPAPPISFAAMQIMAPPARSMQAIVSAWVAAQPDVPAADHIPQIGASELEAIKENRKSVMADLEEMSQVLDTKFVFAKELLREKGLLEKWVNRDPKGEEMEEMLFELVPLRTAVAFR